MATLVRDTIKAHLTKMHRATNKLIEDIGERESMITLDSSSNHIKWITGHILGSMLLQLAALEKPKALPKGWGDLFRRGAEVNPDPAAYPPYSEVRAKLLEFQTAVMEGLDAVDDTYLSTERVIRQDWTDTPAGTILFIASHNFYHAGQIQQIRRVELERARTFG